MGKKRSWINLVKRLFIPEGKSKEEKKSKRWTWVFGRLKFKQYPALAVPQRSLSEATEEQRKHAVAVAIATAAAAEAAVTAAHAAAEVVRLTSVPYRFETLNQNLAAIKIQTSFRAHLAKKALRALKGVVRLQAVIRGQIVRRFITHLKSLQSTEKPHSQVHQIRVPRIDEGCTYGEEKLFPSPRKILGDEDTKIGCKSNKNWDFSLFSKEDREGSLLQKQEAITKRDRMKKYSFSHRERRNNVIFEESNSKEDGKRRSWFEEYQEMDARRRRETEKLKSVEILNSSISLPRRSFCRVNKRHSVTDDTSLPSSPVFPTYMTSTESAKAKVRSASTPRQWLGHQDFCAVHSSLCNKPKISSWSYSDGELAGINGKCATSQHKFVRTNGR